MFTCASCKRKAFSTLINHTFRLQNTAATVRTIYTPTLSRQNREHREQLEHRGSERAHVSTKKLRRKISWGDDEEEDQPRGPRATQIKNARVSKLNSSNREDVYDERDGLDSWTGRGVDDIGEWAAQKQLQYLQDPLHLANFVRNTLKKDNADDALLITRKASKDSKVTVSWNHIINYHLQKGKLHFGIKLYNEMKKRGQQPNAQTYTIIFNGCATSQHSKLAVSEAMRIYNNMLANERITPNTIHLNALLKVCANAEDIESMFTIVQTANEGIRAPNNLTYTIILNALRRKVDRRQYGSIVDVDTPEVIRSKAQTIQRSKAIWEEVISKWKAGSIIIDEELVCAMGWTLLMGDWNDAVSIEALLEQTMFIPKDDRAAIRGRSKGDVNAIEGATDVTDAEPVYRMDNRKIIAPGAPAINYALPGNNSLSLILAALEKTGKTSSASRYWDIFTKKHGVVPDANNWHHMLTTLRRGKNSGQTASYLRDMPAELIIPKNFRTAINTCLRDNLNLSSFIHATEVLKIMLDKLKTPDPITLRNYLRVAYANQRCFIQQFKDTDAAMMGWGKQLATALENIWKPYMTLAKLYGEDGPESNMKRELVALARKVIAATDRVISLKAVTPAVEKEIAARRNSLNRVVVAHFEELEKLDPNLRQKAEVDEEEEDDEMVIA
ncbi:hypothetical protein F5Y11DRAFT_317228 [Daldinia sp. FL1419]|nr:hypothetical protein F5Y11DRAFT_317228 [Daldinia sp. FL1419]